MQVTRAWIEGFICKGRVNDPPKLRFHDLSGFVWNVCNLIYIYSYLISFNRDNDDEPVDLGVPQFQTLAMSQNPGTLDTLN
jgi:hypothetical protein